MASSASLETNAPARSHDQLFPGYSQTKAYGFALLIIVGIGGLVTCGIGAAGFFRVGVLSQLSQIDAILMMSLAGGGGLALLIIGAIGIVKNAKTFEGIYLGKNVWEHCLKLSVDKAPPLPQDIDQILEAPCPFSNDPNIKTKDTHLLVLIPCTLGPKPYSLSTLSTALSNRFGKKLTLIYQDQYFAGQKMLRNSYWILVPRKAPEDSRTMTHQDASEWVKKFNRCRLPTALEAATCAILYYLSSGGQLFHHNKVEQDLVIPFREQQVSEPLMTHCLEIYNSQSFVVGLFNGKRLCIIPNQYPTEPVSLYGVLPVRVL